MNKSVNISITVSEDFRDQINLASSQMKMSTSEFIRSTLAGAIQWALDTDDVGPTINEGYNWSSINAETTSIVSSFINQCCVFSQKKIISCRDLRLAYQVFCHKNNYNPVAAGTFGRILWNIIPNKIRKTTINNGVLVVAYGGIDLSNEFKIEMEALDDNLLDSLRDINKWKKSRWTDDKIIEFLIYCSANGYIKTAKRFNLSENTTYQHYINWRKQYPELNLNPLSTLSEEAALERRKVLEEFVKTQCIINLDYATPVKDIWDSYVRYCAGVQMMFKDGKGQSFKKELLDAYKRQLSYIKSQYWAKPLIRGIYLRSGVGRVDVSGIHISKMRGIDSIKCFLEDWCELNLSYNSETDELYEAFLRYRELKGYPSATKAWLTKAIIIIYPNQVTTSRCRKLIYHGIGLKEEFKDVDHP